MKKLGLFLLTAVLSVGASGCGDVVGVDTPDTADVAGTYTFTKLTATPLGGDSTSYSSPDISGSMTLTSTGSYSFTITFPAGEPESGAGTFTIDDPDIIFTDTNATASSSGVISDDGTTITITQTGEDGETIVIEFTMS